CATSRSAPAGCARRWHGASGAPSPAQRRGGSRRGRDSGTGRASAAILIRMLRFERFAAMSFDCYGTLIDWETGILEALRPLLRRHGVFAEDDRLLELYAAAE